MHFLKLRLLQFRQLDRGVAALTMRLWTARQVPVPGESHAGLADALTLLNRKPEIRERMGAAAWERARKQFSPHVIAACFREKVATFEVTARTRI